MAKVLFCNKCGKKFDWYDAGLMFHYEDTLGYGGTDFDGHTIELDLCCDCAEELIKSCKVSPIQEEEVYN